MQDPEYAEAASVLKRVQRYGQYMMDFPFTSPSSFFHADLLEDWESTDIALIGIPSDAGLTCLGSTLCSTGSTGTILSGGL